MRATHRQQYTWFDVALLYLVCIGVPIMMACAVMAVVIRVGLWLGNLLV